MYDLLEMLPNGGQLLLGFNYKLTQGPIISPKAVHIIPGLRTNDALLPGDCQGKDDEAKQHSNGSRGGGKCMDCALNWVNIISVIL